MKDNRTTTIFLVSVLLCIIIPAVTATTLIAESGTIPTVGTSSEFSIIADSLPNGISGFEIVISLSDPTKGQILSARTPPWASLGEIGGVIVSGPGQTVAVNADSVPIKIGKLAEETSPLVNLTLVTLMVRGDSAGTTDLGITISTLFNGTGLPIAATVQNGTIVVGTPPTTAVTTTATTAVTTTATTAVTTTATTAVTTTATTAVTTTATTAVTTTATTAVTTTATTAATTTTTTPPPTTGSLNIQSTPAAANVFLDGTLVGLTPVTVTGVAPGSHTVRIEKTGYQPYQTTTSVSAGATTVVSAALVPVPDPTTGSVSVQSTPDGANAFLDGTLVGLTPVTVSGVTPGSHQVRIEKTGYEPYQMTASVSAGATTVVSAVLTPGPTPTATTPAPTPTVTATTTSPTPTPTQTSAGEGTLYIRSSPFGARVLVDGVYRGLTPLLLPNVPAGSRQVILEKAGYLTKTFPVVVTAGGMAAPPMVVLERGTSPTTPPTTIPTTGPTTSPTTSPTTMPTTISPFPGATTGTLIVYSMPFGCSVYVDDIPRGLSPVIIRDLAPGTHVVRLTFPGYQEEVRTVQLTAGKWSTITVVLIPAISQLVSAFQ